MIWLLCASLLWAFSFGLIKQYLPGLDPWLVAATRLVLAALAFAPFALRLRPLPASLRARALALGALQFGAMYTCYIAAFIHLAAWQVALWTVLTPILVTLLAALRDRRTTWRPHLAALLAIAGALVAEGRLPRGDTLQGVLLVQASNLCFAAGQLYYVPLLASLRRTAASSDTTSGRLELALLGWMYLGGAALALTGLVITNPTAITLRPDPAAWPVLLYLGLVPTALGFWLWNKGAARTSTGRLAAANNLKVPLAILVAWLIFAESAPYLRAAAGLVVITLALHLADRPIKHPRPPRHHTA